jgi:hypothetical protein
MTIDDAVRQGRSLGRTTAERAMVAALLAMGADFADVERAFSTMRCAHAEEMGPAQEQRLARAIAEAILETRCLPGFAQPGEQLTPADRAWRLICEVTTN